ncbi:MAG: metal ABC transporter substrate-binding protein [Methylibium sp. NZG]|nr:MAG: metal ABC transporter substrate-binding protein [Methylibium sp. NZG]
MLPPPAALPPTPCIASLVPSLTELVVALGLAQHLVARTGYCIHPAQSVAQVPKVGGTKDVNLAKLRRLAPTHVLVNVDENRRETVDALRGWGADAPQIVVTHPLAPHDNLALVEQLVAVFGHVADVRERASALLADLRAELALTRPGAHPPQRVLYLIWREPWMTVARDTYLSNMLALVNWHSLPATHGGAIGAARYPVVHGTEPWLADVQRVLLSSEPYAFGDAHLTEARRLCPNARADLVDGELLSWYGARAVPGLRYLRALAAGLG